MRKTKIYLFQNGGLLLVNCITIILKTQIAIILQAYPQLPTSKSDKIIPRLTYTKSRVTKASANWFCPTCTDQQFYLVTICIEVMICAVIPSFSPKLYFFLSEFALCQHRIIKGRLHSNSSMRIAFEIFKT